MRKARAWIRTRPLTVAVASTDVHEHGKLLVETLLQGLGVALHDGGVSTDPDDLARLARDEAVDAVAVSTYNGVALRFAEALTAELARLDHPVPLLIGGRLNQIPEGSNSSLPVDVTTELGAAGVTVCREIEDMVPALLALAGRSDEES